MIRAAALCLAASPAMSGPIDHWGTSTAALQPCAEADACLTVINQLSGSPDVVDTILTYDGLQVGVHVVMGPGDVPDHVQVIAPRGWLVDPVDADIPEGGFQVFRLFAPQLS